MVQSNGSWVALISFHVANTEYWAPGHSPQLKRKYLHLVFHSLSPLDTSHIRRSSLLLKDWTRKCRHTKTKYVLPWEKPNLSRMQHKTLKSLKDDTNFVIFAADKGRATVVMDKEDYSRKMMTVLDDGKYSTVKRDPLWKLRIASPTPWRVSVMRVTLMTNCVTS